MARKYRRGEFWWIGVYLDGREVRFSTKTRSEAAAERILAKIETEVAESRFLDKKRSSRWTLGEFADVYLSRMDQLRPNSAAWRRDRFKRILAIVGATTPLESITTSTLDAYAETRLRAGKALSTVKSEAMILRHALQQAHRWSSETGLSEYRLKDWSPPRGGREPRRPVFLTRPEVSRLLAAGAARAAQVPEQRRAHVLMRLALETGGRVGELCRIRRQDFEAPRRALRIRALKGGADRAFTLSPANARDLKRLLTETDEPFSGRSAPKDRIRKFWNWVRDEAKLPHVRFHDLRHTFASEYLRQGAMPRLLQDQLGHRTSRMTDVYSHASPRRKAPKGVVWKVKGSHTARTKPKR